jgi:hypothetical protein
MAQGIFKCNREMSDFAEKNAEAFKVPDFQAVALVRSKPYQRMDIN